MEEDEILLFLAAGGTTVAYHLLKGSLYVHPMYLRQNPYPGLTRLGLLGSVLFTLYVLLTFADASVTGIYIVFYLLIGYTLTLWGGHFAMGMVGVRYRIDVCERRNPAAALTIVGLHLAVGLIYGSCLWGEADPYSDDEGGWWIPVGFFAMGYAVFMAGLWAFGRREHRGLRYQLIGERSVGAARATLTYALSLAWIISGAVAGDFFGWAHGIAAIGQVVVLLLIHEVFRLLHAKIAERSRLLESALYLVSGFAIPFALSLIPGWSEI